VFNIIKQFNTQRVSIEHIFENKATTHQCDDSKRSVMWTRKSSLFIHYVSFSSIMQNQRIQHLNMTYI